MKIISLLLSILGLNSAANPKLAMYWQLNTSSIMSIDTIPSWIDIVVVSFATMLPDSTLEFPINDTNIIKGINTAKNKGQIVSLSLFGAANCGSSISQDNTFVLPTFNTDIFVNSLVSIINTYNFTDINIDNECRSGIIQESTNKYNTIIRLKNILPNLLISFSAFSLVHSPQHWGSYLTAYQTILPLINTTYWMAYNINLNKNIATNWYTNLNLTSISNLGVPLNSIFLGYCLNTGCAYGIGASDNQILNWASTIKQIGGGGMFLWDIDGELQGLNYNITDFNTIGLSKQVADILHS